MSSSPHTHSVIIITHNEGHRLADCLDSVRFAHEIIIVDAESTDNTVEIAKQYTPKVYRQPWQGFGRQKQIALNLATQTWVLSLDADEILSPELQTNIQALLTLAPEQQSAGYTLHCITHFCGHFIRYGDWHNERKLRLFQRKKAHFTDDVVHEKLVLDEGHIGKLLGHLQHYSYPNLSIALNKIQRYSTLGAQKKWAAGKRASFLSAIGHATWSFFRGYVLKGGFLDGVGGFLVSFSRLEETFYRYMKLRELCLKADAEKSKLL